MRNTKRHQFKFGLIRVSFDVRIAIVKVRFQEI